MDAEQYRQRAVDLRRHGGVHIVPLVDVEVDVYRRLADGCERELVALSSTLAICGG